MEDNKKVIGKISQVIGAVVDVTFESQEQLPRIYDALEVTRDNGEVIVFECQQDIGENTMRCIAMDSTDVLHTWRKPSKDSLLWSATLPKSATVSLLRLRV